MSTTQIPTFAPFDNLPAPVTSGTTVQSFTDVTGEVWVAKNGVASGVWKRAKDVLYAMVYRASAGSTGSGAFQFDTAYDDVYGMFTAASYGLTMPIAGLWDMEFMFSTGSTIDGGQYGAMFTIGGNQWYGNVFVSGGTAAMAVVARSIFRLSANQLITGYSAVQGLSIAIQTGVASNHLTAKWVGSG